MSIFRNFSSKKNAKGVTGESSDNDLNTLRMAEVRPCEWSCNVFLGEAGIQQDFYHLVQNAGLTPFLEDKFNQYLLLTNTFVQNF